MWYVTFTDLYITSENEFAYVEPSLNLKIKSHLNIVNDSFDMLFSLLIFYLEFLHLYELEILDFRCLLLSFSGFCIRVNLASESEFENIPCILIFGII